MFLLDKLKMKQYVIMLLSSDSYMTFLLYVKEDLIQLLDNQNEKSPHLNDYFSRAYKRKTLSRE